MYSFIFIYTSNGCCQENKKIMEQRTFFNLGNVAMYCKKEPLTDIAFWLQLNTKLTATLSMKLKTYSFVCLTATEKHDIKHKTLTEFYIFEAKYIKNNQTT